MKDWSGKEKESVVIRHPATTQRRVAGFWKRLLVRRLFPGLENSIDMRLLQEFARNNALVFVLPEGGLLEQWFLEYLLEKGDVCNIDFVSRKTFWSHFVHTSKPVSLLRKLVQQYRRKASVDEDSLGALYACLRKSGHSILFFDEREFRETNVLGEHERYLELILEVSRDYSVPVKIVPIIFLWRRSSLRSRSLFNLLSGSPAHPGFLRKLIFFFVRDRPGYLRDAKVFDVTRFMIDSGKMPLKNQVRILRRRLLTSIAEEMRTILGPSYHSPSFLVERILADSEFATVLSEISREAASTVDSVTEEAAIILRNIASDYNFYLLEFISRLGHFFLKNIYDRIVYDRREFQRSKDIGAKHPVVFVPSHKSHIDYCLLTCIFFWEGHAPPRVASGDNLNFWPIGPILRKCGAFFIRRSFRGDRLYSECLRFYIEYLLRRGFNQEFFIEGGRSRTGKLLYPRYGLLNYYVNAVARGVVDDLYFSPISICYDTVAESISYSREQTGFQKKKESLGGLLSLKKALKKRYGCAYVKFGEPFSLREFLRTSGTNYSEATQQQKRCLIKKLAFTIMRGIDRSTIVASVNLTASVLLCARNSGVYVEELKTRVKGLFKYLRERGVPYSDQLDADFDGAFKYSIERLIKEKCVSVNYLSGIDSPGERVYYVEKAKRLDTNFYKNNILSYFVNRSVAMLSLKVCIKDNLLNMQYFWENVMFLRNLLKFEFFFSEEADFKKEIIKEVSSFVEGSGDPSGLSIFEGLRVADDFNDMENRYLLPFFESYYTVARVLEKMLTKTFGQKILMSKIRLMYEKLLWTGEVHLPESHSEVNYANALRLFESMSVLEKEGDELRVTRAESTSGTLAFMRGNLLKFVKWSN